MTQFIAKLEKILYILSLILIAFIPLYPKIPLLNIKGTFVAVRLEDFLIALTLGLLVVYLIITNKAVGVLKDKLIQALLLFFFIGALSLFSGIFLTQTVTPHLGLLHFLRRVEVMMLLPLFYLIINSKERVRVVLLELSMVVLIVTIYGIGQEYLGFPIIATTTSELSKGQVFYMNEWSRVSSTFAGHYDLAIFLAAALVFLGAFFFTLRSNLHRVYLGVLGGLSTIVLIMTAARLSFVAAFIGIVVSLILVKKKKLILSLALVALVILVYPSQLRDRLISTVTVNIDSMRQDYVPELKEQQERSQLNIPTLPVGSDLSSSSAEASLSAIVSAKVASADIVPGEPVDTTQLGVSRSFAIRFDQEWPRALRGLWKNPLLGTGYSSIGLASDNDYLRSLGEVGLLGTFSFGLILLIIIKQIWKSYRQGERYIKFVSAGVLSVILVFLLNALFIDVFEASKIASLFWIILGVNLSLAKAEK